MTIKVPGCRILVKPLKEEEVDEVVRRAKALGITVAADERKQKINMDKGIVLEIGPACDKDYTAGMEVGDTIGFTKFGGKFVREPNKEEDFLIINDEDVVCIFKETV
jgi:co-chaperonin GroES (HSP10)